MGFMGLLMSKSWHQSAMLLDLLLLAAEPSLDVAERRLKALPAFLLAKYCVRVTQQHCTHHCMESPSLPFAVPSKEGFPWYAVFQVFKH